MFGWTKVLAVLPVFVNKIMWADIVETLFACNIRGNPNVVQNNYNATVESLASQTVV